MILHENGLPAEDSHEIACLICYFRKSGKILNCRLLQIIGGALRVKLSIVKFRIEKYKHSQFVLFVWFDSLRPSQQSFSYVGTGLPGLNQYWERINVSCSRTQRSDSDEAPIRGPLVSSQALYHWATALPANTANIKLCKQMNSSIWFDTTALREFTVHIKGSQVRIPNKMPFCTWRI